MPDLQPKQLVLSSSSPRRSELLKQIGVNFIVRNPNVDESLIPEEAPEDYVERLALSKSKVGWAANCISLGADTIVCDGERMLGKPDCVEQGVDMLCALSGRTHQVHTGLAIFDGIQQKSMVVSSAVSFREILPAEAYAYWKTAEAEDKAGGYGIQGLGAIFCEKIEGSYTSIVGLPVYETEMLLRDFGVDTWAMRNNG